MKVQLFLCLVFLYGSARGVTTYGRRTDGSSSGDSEDGNADTSRHSSEGGDEGRHQRKPAFINRQITNVVHELYFTVLDPGKQPRHLVRGALQGLQTFTVGTVIGGALFTAFPVLLAMQSGVTGFVVGLVPGSVLGGVTAFVGVSMGAYQFLASLYNTPTTVLASMQGKTWNADESRWYRYSMDDEYERLMTRDSNGNTGDGTLGPTDTALYDLLQVPPDASKQELRQGYKKMARIYHPDKNSDPSAQEIFLSIHRAYEILTNDESRERYDRQGSVHNSDGAVAGLSFPFSVVLGTQNMMEYTGNLFVTSLVAGVADMHETFRHEDQLGRAGVRILVDKLRSDQKRREYRIAKNLLAIVEDYGTELSADAFRIRIAQQTSRLVDSDIGRQMLSNIGYALTRESSSHLRIDRGVSDMIFKKAYRYQQKLRLLNRVWNFKSVYDDMVDAMEETKPSDSKDALRRMSRYLPPLTDILLSVSILDMSITLEGACWRLFHDSGVPRSERRRRAMAIGVIGEQFRIAVDDHGSGSSDTEKGSPVRSTATDEDYLRARYEVALMLMQNGSQSTASYRNAEEMIRAKAYKYSTER